MAVRLPPLNTLLAFEAAARHSSFTRAAQELSLTHSAISHQISALEARLGDKLFRREHNRMRPTERGRELWFQVRYALDLLERAFEQSHVAGPTRIDLNISVLPSFARRWLLPRLPEFCRTYPLLNLTIRTSTELARIGADGIDCAIRYGIGDWPGLQQERLADDALVVVCSPNYREARLPQTPAALVECTLLNNPFQPWESWLQVAGVALPEGFRFGLSFSDSGMVLDAAANGMGIALGRQLLVQDDLACGRLVQLFELSVADDKRYHFVWRADNPKLAAILDVRRWLLGQL
jgi:LysR family glycine cleavage system transcriptional activator